MKTITIPIAVSIPEAARPFGDDLIHRRLREAVTIPPASKLLGVRILGKERNPDNMDFIIKGELTFGRWFSYRREA